MFFTRIILFIILIVFASCSTPPQDAETTPPAIDDLNPALDTIDPDELNVVTGQTIYVPAYSEIYTRDGSDTFDLTITLTIHNTDLDNPIVLTSVRYYNTNGDLVEEYLDTPQQLAPIATATFVIAQNDRRGGIGANFIVDWVAETNATVPIAEAVMISNRGTEGISFLSVGRVIAEHTDEE